MVRYGARAVAWHRVMPAAGLVLVLMELVARWPYATWALQGAAVGLLAAAAAWGLDEPGARIVDTSPRSLCWRTGARAPVAGLLLATWTTAVVRSWDSFDGHGPTVLLQGGAAVAVATGWATWRRTGGVATPGTVFAAGVIPASLAWGLTPASEWIPVFPHIGAPAGDWSVTALAWSTATVAALVLLACALGDARWWAVRASGER